MPERLDARSALAAARSVCASLGLPVDAATVLTQSNRLVARVLPCDVLARVARRSTGQAGAEREVFLASQLARIGAPVAVLEPRAEARVYESGGFAVTLWRYYPRVQPGDQPPAEYARALHRLHTGLRDVDLAAPRFTDRVAEAQAIVSDPGNSPGLPGDDRAFLGGAITALSAAVLARGAPEHPIHGEPHPGNLLSTSEGLLFIDLETCCTGPVEFDLAHAPEDVAQHYPGIDPDLLRDCRLLANALVAAWRWDRDDEFPDGRRMGEELLTFLRAELARRP